MKHVLSADRQEICYLNQQFIRLIREDPNVEILRTVSNDGTSYRSVIAALNALEKSAVERICNPLGSLLFRVELVDHLGERSRQNWVEDAWLFAAKIASRGNVTQFSVLTGMSHQRYQDLRNTPGFQLRSWASRTQLGFRHPPKLWASILDRVANEGYVDQEIAPILGVYASLESIGRNVA